MKLKRILLFTIGIVLLLFGNRKFWDIYQEGKLKAKKQEELAHANDDVVSRFETQKLVYDTETSTWNNPNIYFRIINLGNVNYDALKKKNGSVKESNTVENASSSQ